MWAMFYRLPMYFLILVTQYGNMDHSNLPTEEHVDV